MTQVTQVHVAHEYKWDYNTYLVCNFNLFSYLVCLGAFLSQSLLVLTTDRGPGCSGPSPQLPVLPSPGKLRTLRTWLRHLLSSCVTQGNYTTSLKLAFLTSKTCLTMCKELADRTWRALSSKKVLVVSVRQGSLGPGFMFLLILGALAPGAGASHTGLGKKTAD